MVVIRMGGEAGVVNLLDLRMPGEDVRECRGVRVVCRDGERQRLHRNEFLRASTDNVSSKP
jgi:hypothetical protein